MSTKNTDVHVVLGAGPAGAAIVTELRQRGLPTRHVSRQKPTPVDEHVQTIAADISDPQEAIAATAGATAIYHAINVPYHLQITQMPRIAEAVIAAAEAHDARLVILDTLYPYGQADGEHITEQTPWAATTRKGRMRAELDHQYLGAHKAGRISVTLGRAADFFGPGVFASTLGAGFFAPALAGQPVLAMGDITIAHSYTYIHDVAAGLVTLGTDDRGLGKIWHLPTIPAVTTADIHHRVGEMLGYDITATVLTEAKPFGPFDEQFMSEYAEMFYQHEIPQNMVSTAFETTFGIHPTPLDHALRTTIDWFAAAPPA